MCPSWASTGQLEQHITGDIAIAAQQFWYATNNRTWLRLAFPGLLKETARFWTSRVEWDVSVAHINHVIPPDEYATGNDSIYTNYAASRNLLFSAEAADELGESAPTATWKKVAGALPLLFNDTLGVHMEYAGYSGAKIKQADVVLLGYPLMMNMSKAVRKADVEYYSPRTDPGAA